MLCMAVTVVLMSSVVRRRSRVSIGVFTVSTSIASVTFVATVTAGVTSVVTVVVVRAAVVVVTATTSVIISVAAAAVVP